MKSSQLLPAHRFDQLARHQIEHVVVCVRAAEARRQRNEAEPPGNLLAVVGRLGPPQQIPAPRPRPLRCTSRSRTVSSRVTYGSDSANAGQVPNDRRVPLDFVLLDEQAQRRRGERLGVGGDAEQGLRVDRRRLPELADAITLRHHHAIVFDHRQAIPGPRRSASSARPTRRGRGVARAQRGRRRGQEERDWGDAPGHGARDYTASRAGGARCLRKGSAFIVFLLSWVVRRLLGAEVA